MSLQTKYLGSLYYNYYVLTKILYFFLKNNKNKIKGSKFNFKLNFPQIHHFLKLQIQLSIFKDLTFSEPRYFLSVEQRLFF